ncbi:MAG: methyl-accepting chemotaxis protein [Mariprofundales bacterium]
MSNPWNKNILFSIFSMIFSISVQRRLLLAAFILAVLPVTIASMVLGNRSTMVGERLLNEQASRLLIALRDNKKTQLETYFIDLRKQVLNIAANPTFSDASLALSQAVTNAGIDAEESETSLDNTALWMQNAYIINNDNAKNIPEMEEDYHEAHAQYHPVLSKLAERMRYDDILIADTTTGRIIYSVNKNADFGISLKQKYYAKSVLGKLFEQARNADMGTFLLSEFAPYSPADGRVVAFAASPIFMGRFASAVLIIRISGEIQNDILTQNKNWEAAGLGNSGEVYVVAKDKYMRSISRPLVQNPEQFISLAKANNIPLQVMQKIKASGTTIGILPTSGLMINNSLQDHSGIVRATDYLGRQVLAAYSPINIFGLSWGLVAQMNIDEIGAPAAQLKQELFDTAISVALVVAGLALILGWGMSRGLLLPLNMITATVRRLSEGDYSARCGLITRDEYQELGDAIDRLVDEREGFMRSEDENDQLNSNIIAMLQAVKHLSERNLTVSVPVSEDVVGPLADALNMMTAEIRRMISKVNQLSEQVEENANTLQIEASSVTDLSEQGKQGVQTMTINIANSSNYLDKIAKLAVSCNGVSKKASERIHIAQDSVAESVESMQRIRESIHDSEKRIKRLGERSHEISGIIDIINSISERTHVLSINASMQAESAGEAGRGFSVVAEEVQRLAENARSATAQISTQVRNIQIETADAVETMSRTIEQVNAGSQLANSSGKVMEETQSINARLVKMVELISELSEQQSVAGHDLQKDAEQVQQASDVTAEQLSNQAERSTQLAQYAKELRDTVGIFRLK